jgi:hypothetical protein
VDDLWAWVLGGVFWWGFWWGLGEPCTSWFLGGGRGFCFARAGGLPLSHALVPQSSMNNEDTKLLIVRHF